MNPVALVVVCSQDLLMSCTVKMPEMRLKKFCVLSFHRKSMFGILLPLSAYLLFNEGKGKKMLKKKMAPFWYSVEC